MSTEHTEQHQETEKDSPIRYIEELAGPEDYWLSLTDVARVTRTSDSMVRRWVTSGRLACKREPVGINQRTRMVRASDVKAIRAIVDPAAAITDDIRKMDLASIPKQQEQIIQDHQNLKALLQTVLSESAQAQAATQAALDNITRKYAKLQQDHQLLLERLERAEAQGLQLFEAFSSRSRAQAEQIQIVERKVDDAALHVGKQIYDVQSAQQAGRAETKRLRTDLQTATAAQQDDQAATAATFEQIHVSLSSMQSRQDDQATALQQIQASLSTRLDEQQQEVATLAKDQARDIADLHRQVKSTGEDLTVKITDQVVATATVRTAIVEIQQHANSQELQLNALRRELEDEVLARKAQQKKPSKKTDQGG